MKIEILEHDIQIKVNVIGLDPDRYSDVIDAINRLIYQLQKMKK